MFALCWCSYCMVTKSIHTILRAMAVTSIKSTFINFHDRRRIIWARVFLKKISISKASFYFLTNQRLLSLNPLLWLHRCCLKHRLMCKYMLSKEEWLWFFSLSFSYCKWRVFCNCICITNYFLWYGCGIDNCNLAL